MDLCPDLIDYEVLECYYLFVFKCNESFLNKDQDLFLQKLHTFPHVMTCVGIVMDYVA